MLGFGPNVLAVNQSLPANSVKELIALAKAKPGQLVYASTGVGSNAHFGTELFKYMTGIDMVHVPYRGGAALMQDLIAGNVKVAFSTLPVALPQAQVGSIRIIAVAEKTHAVPYDVRGAEFDHVGERCSFDAIVRIFEINDPALDHLATIVRGADTSRPDLSPQCEGLLAISYGLSANFPDDHQMLEHGMVMYDALYTWCRLQEKRRHSAARLCRLARDPAASPRQPPRPAVDSSDSP